MFIPPAIRVIHYLETLRLLFEIERALIRVSTAVLSNCTSNGFPGGRQRIAVCEVVKVSHTEIAALLHTTSRIFENDSIKVFKALEAFYEYFRLFPILL